MVVVGALSAVAASTLLPFGLARRVESDPGIWVSPVVLVPGASVTQSLVLTLAGAVVGVPAGLIIGRLVWRTLLDGTGVLADARTPRALLGPTLSGAAATAACWCGCRHETPPASRPLRPCERSEPDESPDESSDDVVVVGAGTLRDQHSVTPHAVTPHAVLWCQSAVIAALRHHRTGCGTPAALHGAGRRGRLSHGLQTAGRRFRFRPRALIVSRLRR